MNKIIYTAILIIIMATLTLPTLCLAQATARPPIIPQTSETEILLPHNTNNPTARGEEILRGFFLPALTRTIIALAGATAVLFIIIGAIQILTAYGNEEQLGNAKKTIIFAIVGLIIALLSYAIVSIISSLGNSF